MARVYPGTPVTMDFEVRNAADVLTNAVSVAFIWKIGRGGSHNTSTIPVIASTGIYRVIFTPDGPADGSGRPSTVFWKFSSVSPTVTQNGHFWLERAEFDELETNYI